MTTEEFHHMEDPTTRRGLKWGGVALITGALMLGSIATVAAANDTGTPDVAAAIAPQGAPEGTPAGVPPGPPEGVPPGPPEGVGGQSENGNGGRPDGVGGRGNGNMPALPTLPEQASDEARAALEAVGTRHALIADRLDAMRAVEPGPGRGEHVSEIAKDFGEQFRALAATLAGEGDDEE